MANVPSRWAGRHIRLDQTKTGCRRNFIRNSGANIGYHKFGKAGVFAIVAQPISTENQAQQRSALVSIYQTDVTSFSLGSPNEKSSASLRCLVGLQVYCFYSAKFKFFADLLAMAEVNQNTSVHNSKWQEGFTACTNRYFGYVNTVEEALAKMKQYELDTTSRFSCFSYFGSTAGELLYNIAV